MTPAETAAILRQLHDWLRGGTQWAPTMGAEAVKTAIEMIERLKAAEKRTAKLEERCAVTIAALRLAVRQNSHDMLMTAEELRSCEAILEETK